MANPTGDVIPTDGTPVSDVIINGNRYTLTQDNYVNLARLQYNYLLEQNGLYNTGGNAGGGDPQLLQSITQHYYGIVQANGGATAPVYVNDNSGGVFSPPDNAGTFDQLPGSNRDTAANIIEKGAFGTLDFFGTVKQDAAKIVNDLGLGNAADSAAKTLGIAAETVSLIAVAVSLYFAVRLLGK